MFSTFSPSRPTTASVKLDTFSAPAPDPGFRFLDLPVELREKILVEAIAGGVDPADLLLAVKSEEALIVSAAYEVLDTAFTEQQKYGEEKITQAQWLQLQKPACFLGRIAKKKRSNSILSPMPDEKIEEYAKMPQRIRDAGAQQMATSLYLTWCPGEERLNNPYNPGQTANVLVDAYRTGASELAIDNCYLSAWPKEIAYLTNLRVLKANGNLFDALPEWIDQLSRLKKLYVNNNCIKAVSPKIGRLSVLEEFDVSENLLLDLGPEIGRLVKLKYLNISGNNLTQLPDTIEHLTALQKLDVSLNQFEILPKQIGKLEALEMFNILGNPVKIVPKEIIPFLRALELFCANDNLVASIS